MRRLPSNQRNTRVRRERDVRAFSSLVLLLFCGLVLAVGFVFAARQHFAAVQFGYESESLRNERQKLLAEQQRLLLEKEQVSTPARLESAARQLGLRPLKAGQVGNPRANEQSRLPWPRPSSILPLRSIVRSCLNSVILGGVDQGWRCSLGVSLEGIHFGNVGTPFR